MKFMKIHQLSSGVNYLLACSNFLMELPIQTRLDAMGIVATIGP
ncbi:hypothetical protein N9484_06145 [Polaribacter sp.]|nr:hypothetical protein [Polaribacter sp.]MDB4010592.1 hypothetical protein [Polaribacter sp.]